MPPTPRPHPGLSVPWLGVTLVGFRRYMLCWVWLSVSRRQPRHRQEKYASELGVPGKVSRNRGKPNNNPEILCAAAEAMLPAVLSVAVCRCLSLSVSHCLSVFLSVCSAVLCCDRVKRSSTEMSASVTSQHRRQRHQLREPHPCDHPVLFKSSI